jgi:GNAT superfamily N-acetyltransferase
MNVNVRKATLQDIEQLAVLFDGYRVFYKKEPALTAAAEFLSQRLSKNESEIFVADEYGKLLGFVQLYPLFSSTRMKRVWLLNDLFVDASQRGRGISVVLIDAAKQLCRETGACALMLETAKSNDIGNQLYPRTGFLPDQEHNFYSWEIA